MTLGDWRDLSLILLSIEAMLIGLIYGLIFYYVWKGFRIATSWLRLRGLPTGQQFARQIKTITQRYSKKVVRPVVTLETTLTRTAHTLGAITNIPKQRTWRSSR